MYTTSKYHVPINKSDNLFLVLFQHFLHRRRTKSNVIFFFLVRSHTLLLRTVQIHVNMFNWVSTDDAFWHRLLPHFWAILPPYNNHIRRIKMSSAILAVKKNRFVLLYNFSTLWWEEERIRQERQDRNLIMNASLSLSLSRLDGKRKFFPFHGKRGGHKRRKEVPWARLIPGGERRRKKKVALLHGRRTPSSIFRESSAPVSITGTGSQKKS